MPAKLTQEQWVEKAISVHGDKYDYSKSVYTGNAKPVEIFCNTCQKIFTQRANDHVSKKAGCQSCKGVERLTTEKFIERAKEVHGNKYDYSQVVYKNCESKVTISCQNGHTFEQTARTHLYGFNCPHCAGLARKTTEQFIADSKAIFGDKFDYSKVEYVNSKTPIILICANHGEFSVSPVSHLNSSTGYCEEIANAPSTKEQFIRKAMSVHGNKYSYDNAVYTTNKSDLLITCSKHGDFTQSPHNHYKGSGCPKCAVNDSKPESNLVELLSHYKITKRDRTLLNGKELDILIEEHKVAIEVNGIYFHSDGVVKNKHSHSDKTKQMLNLGYKLFHFTCADVLKKPSIIKSMVDNACGKSTKLQARKLVIKAISQKDQMKFFKENHISGAINCKVAYGLYSEDELVSCMSFGKSRFSKNYEWEIYRFATKLNTLVVGGGSRLFKHFVKENSPESVMSFADRRFGEGNSYLKMGFELERTTDIGYSYHHKDGIVINRMSAQKHKLPELLGDKFNTEKSGRDNMLGAGYFKIYDCGHKVYIYRNLDIKHNV